MTKMKIRRVKTLDELKALAKEKEVEGFINLYGGLRSSKTIHWTGRSWRLFNSIDGSYGSKLNDKKLAEYTNIPKAIKNGVFFVEEE